jgi:exosome complex component RRP4
MDNNPLQGFRLVVPGDLVSEGADFISGHGTFMEDGNIFASQAGVVHKISQVIQVKPLQTAFQPEIGDVVVGRIV